MTGRIFICGDIHGSVNSICGVISQIDNPKKDDKIIICGDAGFEYGTYIQDTAKRATTKFPGFWIVLRGNHDNRYWRDHTNCKTDSSYLKAYQGWYIDENYLVQSEYPKIKYVRDEGGLYKIDNYNFLFVPGAYSVDKFYRLRTNRPWNPGEQLDYKEQHNLLNIVLEANEKNIPIDFVIGHTFPFHRQPYYQRLFLDFLDQSSVDNSMEKFLNILSNEFEKNPSFKQYFGGHFHGDMAMGDKYTMLYRLVEDIKDYV